MLQSIIRRIIKTLPRGEGQSPGFDFPAAVNKYAGRLESEWMKRSEPPLLFSKRIGLVVSPWLFTPAPFFMLELALQLRLAGHPVEVLWDGGNVFVDAAKPRELAVLRPLLGRLPSWLPLVDIATLPAAARETPDFLEELLYENAVRHLRGEAGAEDFISTHPMWKIEMSKHAAQVEGFLRSGRSDLVCIPGGVWASSGVWRKLCDKLGIPYTTYDSGPGQMFVSQNSVAAHFGDIRDTLETLIRSGDDLHPLVELAKKALQTRMEGRDPFALQKTVRTDAGEKYDVFVPLNLRFDSAALCRKRLFRSVTEWLQQLLERLALRPALSVAIRQHPCERIEGFRSRDSWEQILAPFLRSGGQVRFFSAESDVNTYDLIEGAKVVLPFTSRVGIEAAMMGKPVVTSALCYYNDCGFTVAPDSAESYFATIDQAMAGDHKPDEQARLRAAIAYYLMEYCSALSSRFTPQPADYFSWIDRPVQELATSDELRMIVQSASGVTPMTQLLHSKRHRK